MNKGRAYARNLLANWVGYCANLAIVFCLSPFVVHSLGNATYGVWSLIVSLTGYLGLAEMGVRGGLGRFINYYLGQEDVAKVNGVLNAALGFFLCCGLVLLAAAAGMAASFGAMFSKVPIELVGAARTVLLLTAVNLWISLFSASLTQVLTALERFDLSNGIAVCVLALRAGATVAVLRSGAGIVELAAVEVASSVAGLVATYAVARCTFPKLRICPRLASWARFRELFSFSMWAFLGRIGMQLLYWTDAVLIAVLLGAEQVTFYAIASMLVIHARAIVNQCALVLSPQVIKDCARRDWPALQRVFQRGSSLTMGAGIPLFLGLVIFGQEFIVLWMGPEYRVSYPVLVILSFSQLPAVAGSVASSVFSGLNKVKLGAGLTLGQGVVNLALTLAFVIVWDMGIEGVAWGTFVPRVVFAALAVALAIRWIGLRPRNVLRTAASQWAGVGVVFAMMCFGVSALDWEAGWSRFLCKITLVMVLYVPVAWVMFLTRAGRLRWASVLVQRRWGRSMLSR